MDDPARLFFHVPHLSYASPGVCLSHHTMGALSFYGFSFSGYLRVSEVLAGDSVSLLRTSRGRERMCAFLSTRLFYFLWVFWGARDGILHGG